jgi:hypothetical protein
MSTTQQNQIGRTRQKRISALDLVANTQAQERTDLATQVKMVKNSLLKRDPKTKYFFIKDLNKIPIKSRRSPLSHPLLIY